MAFVTRNSKIFINNKLKNTTLRNVFIKSRNFSNNAKFSVCSILNLSPGHQFSTATKHQHRLRPGHGRKYTFASSIISIHHCLSTDSNLEVIISEPVRNQFTNLSSNAADQNLDKVLFIDPQDIITSNKELVTDIAPTITTDIAPQITTDIAETLSSELSSITDIVEPTLASLGLASWTPVGIAQQCFEFLHISMHMPWWLTIITATAVARLLMFPLFVKTQKNAVKFANHMPQLQFLQAKFGEARKSGNSIEASRYASEMMVFMKAHKLNPLRNALLPLAQAPVFISFFLGLRGMARLPVESMKDGGIWWITDLTIPDPYLIMPFVACSTLYVVLKLGAESGIKMENMKMARYVLQFTPIILFPFCLTFPSAVLFYWCTTNLISLSLVVLMKIPSVKQFLQIPTQIKIDPKFVPEKKGFVKGIKDAYNDQKILKTVEDRARIDEIRFRKAGTGPIPRTYSYDPTKPRPAEAAAQKAKGYKT